LVPGFSGPGVRRIAGGERISLPGKAMASFLRGCPRPAEDAGRLAPVSLAIGLVSVSKENAQRLLGNPGCVDIVRTEFFSSALKIFLDQSQEFRLLVSQ
jgi:hypothetical protein